MKIKYVGVKADGETAFAHDAGIGERWMPGSSHEVANVALCKKMLQHPDVFALEKDTPAPGPAPASTASASVALSAAIVNTPLNTDSAPTSASISLAPGTAVGAVPPAPPPAAPLHTIKVDEGDLVLDGMEAPALHELAVKLGVKLHPQTGAKRAMELLVASQVPPKKKK